MIGFLTETYIILNSQKGKNGACGKTGKSRGHVSFNKVANAAGNWDHYTLNLTEFVFGYQPYSFFALVLRTRLKKL